MVQPVSHEGIENSRPGAPRGRPVAPDRRLRSDGLRHHVVEEGPVVADQEQRARVVLQQLLEQFQRLDVEVVGRLVEHQHVGRRANRRASSRRLRSPPDSD
jgi:chloramphenicol 3-O-phosphotransferase